MYILIPPVMECPFCGPSGKVVLDKAIDKYDGVMGQVECYTCEVFTAEDLPSRALRAWNTRGGLEFHYNIEKGFINV